MFLVIILERENVQISHFQALSEQKVILYGVMNFNEVRVKNDGKTLFQNPMRFLHHPITGHLISSQDIDNTKAKIILPSDY